MFNQPAWGDALGLLITMAIVVVPIWMLYAYIMSRPSIMPPIPDETQVRDALRERTKTQRYFGNRDETK